MGDPSCMIIAHRGESFEAPENTMASIKLAWELGADAVEIDVQLSKDNKVVVIHDLNTKRLAGVNKKVRNQTLEELKSLDVGVWKDIQWKGEKIPTLLEVLQSLPNDKKLVIEIKGDQNTIPFIEENLHQISVNSEQIEFIGFNLSTVSATKKKFPEHKVLWLLDLDYYWINRIVKPSISRAIKKARQYGLDGLNVWAGKMLDQKLINHVKSSGLLLYTWTVNDIAEAKKLIDLGVDAITTDGAHWIKTHLALSS